MVEWKNAVFRVFSGWKTVLLGIIISIVPVLNFATYGFGLNCARKPYDKRAPAWSRFGSLWVEGLLAIIIILLYLLPAIILLLWGLLAEEFALWQMISIGILGVIAYYFLPMAWLEFANNGFGAAFKFSKIVKLCFHGKYFGAWLLLFILVTCIGLVLNLLALLLAITVVLPVILGGFAAFWLTVFSFTVYGQLYEELR